MSERNAAARASRGAAQPSLLTTAEAAEQAGITVRQLDNWARSTIGIIQPSRTPVVRSGRHRMWEPEEVKVLRLLGYLANLRVPMAALAAANVALQGIPLERGDERWLVVSAPDKKGRIVTQAEFPRIARRYKGAIWAVPLSAAQG